MAEQGKTIVIVGGVAGGASAAARLRRLDESAEIIVLERSGYVSFANCGLPYHLSSTIPDRSDLLLQTPLSLYERFRLDVRVRQEVTGIDRGNQTVSVRDLETEHVWQQRYDVLILSPGASPIVPPIEGSDAGLVLRNVEDLDRMMAAIAGARSVAVVGGGFIGLEAAENLARAGLAVTVIEQGDQVLAPLDPEMAGPLAAELRANGVAVELGRSIAAIQGGRAVLDDGREIAADAVILAIGVRPDIALARAAGLVIGPRGGIAVDDQMRTSDPRIFAVGDAVEKDDLLDGQPVLTPLANIATRQGRRAADAIMGNHGRVQPSQATAIVKVFGVAAASTGWNEKRLRAAGRDFLAIHTHPFDHAAYYPGAQALAIKLLIDPVSGTILGAQAVGRAGADKRIDVLATAMRAGLNAVDLIDLELAYAPPYGSAKDPINHLGYIAENILGGITESADWSQIPELQARGWTVLDVRSDDERASGFIPASLHIPLDQLRQRGAELQGRQVVAYCAAGQRSHIAAQYLKSQGIPARNLDGGWTTWRNAHLGSACPPVGSAEPIHAGGTQ